MANPFTTRATEFVKSNEAFLTLIAPDPVSFFLEPRAHDDGLYRRLLSIQGQPGSGKTTIARLFEFSTLATLLRGGQNETYSELIGPLQKCGAIRDGLIQILACRLPQLSFEPPLTFTFFYFFDKAFNRSYRMADYFDSIFKFSLNQISQFRPFVI